MLSETFSDEDVSYASVDYKQVPKGESLEETTFGWC